MSKVLHIALLLLLQTNMIHPMKKGLKSSSSSNKSNKLTVSSPNQSSHRSSGSDSSDAPYGTPHFTSPTQVKYSSLRPQAHPAIYSSESESDSDGEDFANYLNGKHWVNYDGNNNVVAYRSHHNSQKGVLAAGKLGNGPLKAVVLQGSTNTIAHATPRIFITEQLQQDIKEFMLSEEKKVSSNSKESNSTSK